MTALPEPGMGLETEPAAAAVEVSETDLTVRLADGHSLTVPLAWYPRLAHGTWPGTRVSPTARPRNALTGS